MKQLLLATRSQHKLRELRRILGPLQHELGSLRDLDLPESAEEDNLENADTFLGNASAKARYFSRITNRLTLADDSGLEVAALGWKPGVHTRRFALLNGAASLSGDALDQANNELLLKRLNGLPGEQRAARYVCAAALAQPDGSVHAALGTCSGQIARAPAGDGGFGYDPLFLLPELSLTFAQLSPEQKDQRSHRARAFRALAAWFL